MKTIGALAIQGDFKEHMALLHSMGVGCIEVRSISDMQKCSALIIPGGESTTISKLLSDSGLGKEIKSRAKKGMPVYGTCAGAIVIAKKVAGEKRFSPLGLIDIEVERNAYGRQADSFESEIDFAGGKIRGVFIRAPLITKIGKGVEALATLNGRPVLVRQGKIIAGTFHPELAGERAVHELLLGLL